MTDYPKKETVLIMQVENDTTFEINYRSNVQSRLHMDLI